jgi:hypothetical protein
METDRMLGVESRVCGDNDIGDFAGNMGGTAGGEGGVHIDGTWAKGSCVRLLEGITDDAIVFSFGAVE